MGSGAVAAVAAVAAASHGTHSFVETLLDPKRRALRPRPGGGSTLPRSRSKPGDLCVKLFISYLIERDEFIRLVIFVNYFIRANSTLSLLPYNNSRYVCCNFVKSRK